MRSRVSRLWVLVFAFLAGGASALPLDVTYSVTVEIAASSGLTPNRQFAGTVTIRFPDGGDPALGGALSFAGQLELMGGTLTATGAPLELTSGPVSTIVFPHALSFPYGTGFFNFVSAGTFFSEGTVVPGQLTMDFTAVFPPDSAIAGFRAPEMSRQLVPEPAAATLVGVGVAAGIRARTRAQS